MLQSQALDILKTGANVFLTGEPGAGKTHVINQYITWLEASKINVAVTASTGIAATHLGGMTIHSWSGIGAREFLSPYDLDQITSREKLQKRHKKAQVLVIDEISMLDGSVLEMIDKVLRHTRDSSEAFGGLQVIVVGDFFQLPPIVKQGDIARYAFESAAWDNLRPLVCYLHEQFRQDDELLLGLLKSIRSGDINEDHYTLLSEQTEIAFSDIEPTKLYTHNADVDSVNAGQLKGLSGPSKKFTMSGQGNKQMQQGLAKSCLSPELLELKAEAMVMCTKNNFEAGYVNGTLARVIDFDPNDGLPIIKTTEGIETKMKPMSWDLVEDGKVLASVEQVPLRLAWAITVHKSQGMSLDAAEMDLSRAFVYGQGYVALSRVRTLAGLKVLGMGANALLVDPKIIMQDRRFKLQSADARATFEGMEESEIATMQQNFVKALRGVWPSEAAVAAQEANEPKRVKKEDTVTVTHELIVAGNPVAAVAKERSLSEGTIWGHVETLLEQGKLSEPELQTLLAEDVEWEVAKAAIADAIPAHGSEKLKPLYEHTNEQYEYYVIRLARAALSCSK